MVETVTIEMRRSLAEELADVLKREGQNSEEYHSTEQVMEEGANVIRDAL